MALSLTPVKEANTVFGNKRVRVFDVEFDDSYPTGGESLTPEDVGLRKIDQVLGSVAVSSSDAAAVAVAYDFSNEKLQAFQQEDPGDAGGAAIPLPEVGSTDDLEGFTARLTFIGY